MKPRLLLCLALVLSGEVVGFSQTATNVEPRYLDKSLSEWVVSTRSIGGDVYIPGDARAFDAIRQIGTNAIPCLLQWLRSDNLQTARLGIEGFDVLGPISKPALPELVRMAYDWQTSTVWSNAVPTLAVLHDTNADNYAYAVSYLLPLATNQAAPAGVRQLTISSITKPMGPGYLGTNSSLAASLFILCLQDKDWRIAAAAANALGNYRLEPKLAIPALAACLMSHTNVLAPSPADDDPYHWHGDVLVRYNAVNALGEFVSPYYRSTSELDDLRPALSNSVPAMLQALNDRDWRVARDAATAMGSAAIEPEIVVPALVRSLGYSYSDKYEYGAVRQAAIEALGNYGEAARLAVPALTKLAQSDPNGYVGGPFAANALKKIIPQRK